MGSHGSSGRPRRLDDLATPGARPVPARSVAGIGSVLQGGPQWGRATELLQSWLPELEVVLFATGASLLVLAVGLRVVVPALTRLVRRRNAGNPTVVEAAARYSRLVVGLVALLAFLQVAGYDAVVGRSALVVAAATLALGVAGQEVIGNLVSGLFLVADPEFSVGDWIEWEGGAGVVEAIRFRSTRVRTADGELLTVPNTMLTTSAVARPYSRRRVRVSVRLLVPHGTDAEPVRDALRDAVEPVEDVAASPAPTVIADELDEDGLWLASLFWLPDPSRRDVRRARSTYLLHLHDRLDAADVSLGSPPTEVAVSGAVDLTSAPHE